MFYKREGKERWLGPATVIFQDGKVVFVRHGGIFVRVSPNRLKRIDQALDRNESSDKAQTVQVDNGDEINEEEQGKSHLCQRFCQDWVLLMDKTLAEPDRNAENQLSVTDRELPAISETATGGVENDRDTERSSSVKVLFVCK